MMMMIQAERGGDCNGIAIGGYHGACPPRIERGSNVIPPWRQISSPQTPDGDPRGGGGSGGIRGRRRRWRRPEGRRRVGRQLVQLMSQVAQMGIEH